MHCEYDGASLARHGHDPPLLLVLELDAPPELPETGGLPATLHAPALAPQ
jgi:hypothetical protein